MSPDLIASLTPQLRKAALAFRAGRGFLAPSLDIEDLVQEGLLLALQSYPHFTPGRAQFSTYLLKSAWGRWADLCARSHFGPSARVRFRRRKRGLPVDYGEVSLDQNTWSDRLQDEGVGPRRMRLAPGEAAPALAEARRLLSEGSDRGISFAKTRNKYHVQPRVLGHEPFVGQFKTLGAARVAKRAFFAGLVATLSEVE